MIETLPVILYRVFPVSISFRHRSGVAIGVFVAVGTPVGVFVGGGSVGVLVGNGHGALNE